MSRRLIASLLTFTGLTGAAFAQAPADAQPAPAATSAPADVPKTEAKPDSSQAEPAQTSSKSVEATAPHVNAGFGNEAFFLRSDDDNFVLVPAGRLQVDFYGFQGAGHDKQQFNTFLPKRARIELFGTIMKHWDFQLGSEFTSGAAPIATDIFLNANYTPYANLQIGQFDAPFTMENRTSDKWTDMQERSRVVAAFALPENKEVGAMVWGQPQKKWAYWSGGVFNGEGQNNFRHVSNHFDAMGRAWIAPGGIAGIEAAKNIWVGGSYLNGFRNESPANADFASSAAYTATFANQFDRAAMKDTAGDTFFNPVAGNLHAGDYGQRTAWAAELNAPIGQLVLKGEYVHVDEGLRELDLSNTLTAPPGKPSYVRTSRLHGDGFYARASYFFWGDPLINGLAGTQNPPRLIGDLKPGKTADALQLVVNWDHLGFDYSADNDPNNKDPLAGNYRVNIYGVGLNYWYTKHIRVTGNFLYDHFAGSGYEKPDGSFKNTPLAPSGGNAYELTFRVALAI